MVEGGEVFECVFGWFGIGVGHFVACLVFVAIEWVLIREKVRVMELGIIARNMRWLIHSREFG